MCSDLSHRPVLLDEVLEALAVVPDGIYLDGTFGRGGHSAALLEQLSGQGRLLACDKDPQALAVAQERFGKDDRFEIVRGSFTSLKEAVEQRDWAGKVNGVMLDLGVSSPQLDDAERGFSFMKEGPLDMRMDPEQGASAAAWLAEADEGEIAMVLKEYGEERFAKRIARAIVTRRDDAPLHTTSELAELVAQAVPKHEKHKHPATRTFQAIRIYINRELEELDQFLSSVVQMLAPGGRLAVISFHSLEDRRVKRFIRSESKGEQPPHGLPLTEVQMAVSRRLKAVGKAIKAGKQEVAENPRARSAVLRVAERT